MLCVIENCVECCMNVSEIFFLCVINVFNMVFGNCSSIVYFLVCNRFVLDDCNNSGIR